jgi:two-component system heavy metal sensor histidine kinase CusS
MVGDMLFIAKADEGQIVPSRKSVALTGVVDELVEFYRLATDEKGISLSSSGSAEIVGDPLMVRRALSNLIANAVGHTPAGGRIDVRIEKADAAMVRLAVENTGETIAPQHLPRLFDRFYRVDPSRHRASDGAGLGLAITQSIAEAHGGTVSVRSSQGVTVFEILLPV